MAAVARMLAGPVVLDLRPILQVIGILLIILALFMAPPMVADVAAGHRDWQVFLVSGSVTLFIGVSLVLMNRAPGFGELSGRQAFLLTTMVWVVMSAFAALPLAFSELQLGAADAVFEAMSGITTTGATVIVGLDAAPPGILLWRAILHWLGGIGFIVMGVAILPILRVGGMQLVRTEFVRPVGEDPAARRPDRLGDRPDLPGLHARSARSSTGTPACCRSTPPRTP